MTISKGRGWGVQSPLPPEASLANSDAELAGYLYEGVEAGVPAIVGLVGGALWQVLGGETLRGRIKTANAFTYPVDLGVLATEHGEYHFVNHVISRSRTWRTGFAVMNGQSTAGLRFGHRSHPNDGLLDLSEWSLRWSDLRSVAKRARHGAHTPHPRITERRAPKHTIELERARPFEVDDVAHGSAQHFEFSVIADAGFVVA
jgi:hypothetical protein